MQKRRNPLWYVLVAIVITLPFDFYYYIVPFNPFGAGIVVGKIAFIVLYARRSRSAWHLAFLVTGGVVPLSLLMVGLGIMPEARHPSRHVFDIAIVVLLLVYLWSVRERYFCYVEGEI